MPPVNHFWVMASVRARGDTLGSNPVQSDAFKRHRDRARDGPSPHRSRRLPRGGAGWQQLLHRTGQRLGVLHAERIPLLPRAGHVQVKSPSRRPAEWALVGALVAASALAACSSKTTPYPMLNPMPEDAATLPTGAAGVTGGSHVAAVRIAADADAAGERRRRRRAERHGLDRDPASPAAGAMLSANAAADVAARRSIAIGTGNGMIAIDPRRQACKRRSPRPGASGAVSAGAFPSSGRATASFRASSRSLVSRRACTRSP